MQTVNELLDAAKRAQGIDSDYRLAKLLELRWLSSTIGNYRTGRSTPDDEVSVRLAALIGCDPAYVIACLHAERAKKSEQPQALAVWEAMAAKYRAAEAKVTKHLQPAVLALLALLLSLFVGGGPDAGAQAATLPYLGKTPGEVCILCLLALMLRRVLRRLNFPPSGFAPA